jgi:thiopeptide-type bacteriocin biosynthesis protein
MNERDEACLYAAIEAPRDRHDDLLRELIAPLVREVRGHRCLDSLFVVRYAEPEWQLRVRVLGRPEWIKNQVRPRVERALEPFRASGAIGGVTFGEYVREWDRYGGPEGMRLAEQIFLHDSLACLDLLDAEARGACVRSRREWSLVFTEDFLDLLGLDDAARVRFYRDAHAWAFREGLFEDADRQQLDARYHAVRSGLAASQAARRRGDAAAAYGGAVPAAIARTRLDATRPVIAEILDRRAAGVISEDPMHLAWSYTHMHCNRLGLDLPAEAILRYLMFRFYEDETRAPDAAPSI